MKKQWDILIIGGGASGLMAAIAAATNGAKVGILEKSDRVGKKILATGNGRCNLTNINMNPRFFHSNNRKFIKGPLNSFDVNTTLDFFEYLGLAYKVEDNSKVYPKSDQASSVLDILRYRLEELGVKEFCNAEVVDIEKKSNEFSIRLKDGRMFKTDKVIIATGGSAAPQFGSDGNGHTLAKSLGHRITDVFPALVQLKLKADFLKFLKGVKFIGGASVIYNNGILRKEDGEILFTDYGISGPPILQLSRMAAEKLHKNQRVYIELDMFPNMDVEELTNLLQIRLAYHPKRPLNFAFVSLINKRMIPVILKNAGITDIHKKCIKVNKDEIKSIIGILKNWQIEIIGTQNWRNAQVTAGGVDLRDINPNTMESKLIPNLYIVGEVLDVDGDCGGFNLQWAWSTGYIAGESASS